MCAYLSVLIQLIKKTTFDFYKIEYLWMIEINHPKNLNLNLK